MHRREAGCRLIPERALLKRGLSFSLCLAPITGRLVQEIVVLQLADSQHPTWGAHGNCGQIVRKARLGRHNLCSDTHDNA